MQLRIKLFFAQSQHKIFLKCKQEEKSGFHPGKASLVLARALWTHAQAPDLSQAKLPNGPVNHMQLREEAYTCLCQFMAPNRRGVETRTSAWGGPDRLAWHRLAWLWFEDERAPRNLSWYPLCPLPVFLQVSRSCCGAADPADCVDRDPADQHKHWHYCLSAGKQKLWRAVCGFMWVTSFQKEHVYHLWHHLFWLFINEHFFHQ